MEWLYAALLSAALTLIGLFLLLKKLGNDIGNAFSLFGEIFEKPTVSRAMSIIGQKGGDSKSQREIQNKIAASFINKNYGLIKMLGEQMIGIDVDGLIEEYGAINILKAIREIAPQLGININDLTSGLKIPGISSSKPSEAPKFKL